jgi:hypothetical protein
MLEVWRCLPKGFLCHCEESFFRKDDEAISGLGEMNGD